MIFDLIVQTEEIVPAWKLPIAADMQSAHNIGNFEPDLIRKANYTLKTCNFL